METPEPLLDQSEHHAVVLPRERDLQETFGQCRIPVVGEREESRAIDGEAGLWIQSSEDVVEEVVGELRQGWH